MLEITGWILLAVAALAVLALAFRFIVLALSAVFCLVITAGAWLLLASGVGEWWATATLVVGFAIWAWCANRKAPIEKIPDASAHATKASFGQKIL